MKVYFCGSIRGGRDDVHLYRKIVTTLQGYGSVLTEHVSSPELTDRGQTAGLPRTQTYTLHMRSVSSFTTK